MQPESALNEAEHPKGDHTGTRDSRHDGARGSDFSSSTKPVSAATQSRFIAPTANSTRISDPAAAERRCRGAAPSGARPTSRRARTPSGTPVGLRQCVKRHARARHRRQLIRAGRDENRFVVGCPFEIATTWRCHQLPSLRLTGCDRCGAVDDRRPRTRSSPASSAGFGACWRRTSPAGAWCNGCPTVRGRLGGGGSTRASRTREKPAATRHSSSSNTSDSSSGRPSIHARDGAGRDTSAGPCGLGVTADQRMSSVPG